MIAGRYVHQLYSSVRAGSIGFSSKEPFVPQRGGDMRSHLGRKGDSVAPSLLGHREPIRQLIHPNRPPLHSGPRPSDSGTRPQPLAVESSAAASCPRCPDNSAGKGEMNERILTGAGILRNPSTRDLQPGVFQETGELESQTLAEERLRMSPQNLWPGTWAGPRVTLKTTECTDKLPAIRRRRRRVSSEHQLKWKSAPEKETSYLQFNYIKCDKLVSLEHVWASKTLGEPKR